ncbi:MAG: FliM/FliN family flagellar motor switch protein [Nannocystaceae bacterium]|nr:FliM/FliN family flagellar motor switch protein [Nannocystaceae bacterium]
MDETLTGDERDALRESMVSSVSDPEKKGKPPQARPVALIAEDQAAERVMPTARRVTDRWATHIGRIMPPLTGVKVSVKSIEHIETNSGEILEALRQAWVCEMKPKDGEAAIAVAVSGRMIPDLACTMLGGTFKLSEQSVPTPATIRVFEALGERIAESAAFAFEHECGGILKRGAYQLGADTWSPLVEGEPMLMVSVEISGETEGKLHLITSPDALHRVRTDVREMKVVRAGVRHLLGKLETDLSVQLGTAKTTARKFAELGPGSILTLDALVGDSVRIFVGGQLRATGRAVLIGEMVAVEVNSVV